MNNRAFTISFLVAFLAVIMVHQYVTSTEESYKQRFGVEVSVVVASKDITELDTLDKTNLEIKTVPKQFLQPGAGNKIEEFEGGLAIAPLSKGEQITRSRVTTVGTRTGLSRQVAVGKRAFTVNASMSRAVSNLIKPGDRVDVIAILDYGKGDPDLKEVKTVMQDVLVLATGKLVTNTVPGIIERDPSGKKDKNPRPTQLSEYTTYNAITLEIDPFEAQKLVMLESQLGGVYMTLRNNDDNAREELDTVGFMDILGVDSKRGRQSGEYLREQARRQALQNPQPNRTGPPTGIPSIPTGGGGGGAR
jgi:pilus assembly protein CpaB